MKSEIANMSEKIDTLMSQRETEDEGQIKILFQQSKNATMIWAERYPTLDNGTCCPRG